MQQIIEEAYGNTRVVLEYDEENQWIYADWIGVHSLPSIKKGTEAITKLFQKTGCTKYLSDNTNIVGSFDMATDYLANEWTPQVMAAGMRHVAHVLSPGVYAKRSMQTVTEELPNNLNIKLFNNLTSAQEWLAAQE